MNSSSMSVDLQAHFDWVAQRDARARRVQSGFHRQIQGILRHRIPAGCSVLEVGCARGDVLADLRPSRGVGGDLSPVMLE
ncbi:MAG: glycosyl transferase, partial [Verrucomicrobiota bacterium]